MKKLPNYLVSLRKYEILIASTLVLVVVLILASIFLKPNYLKAQEIYLEQKKVSAQLASLKKKANSLASIDSGYYKDNLVKLTQVLPLDKDFVSLFATFDMLQAKTGAIIMHTEFELESISSTSGNLSTREIRSQTLPMKLEVLGDETALLQFLDLLDDLSGRIITVDNTALTLQEDGLILALLTAQAYYNTPTKTVGIDSPLPEISKSDMETLERIASSVIILPAEDSDEVSVGKENLFQ